MSMPSSSEAVDTTAGSRPSFRRGLRLLPHLQGDAAVVGTRQVLIFVQRRRDPLDGTAVVGEDDRRTVLPNLPGEQAVDRRPNRLLRQRPELLDGIDDEEIEVLANAGVDDVDRPRCDAAVGRWREAAEIAGHLLQRPLRRRQADAHKRSAALNRFEPFEQQSKKDAALVGAKRVDLIDDDVRNLPQRIAGTGSQQQVQRFRRGDEHVRRLANEALAFRRRRVAGTDGGANLGQRLAEAAGGLGDTLERHLQVAVNVVVERFQRRDIEDTDAGSRGRLAP